MAIGLVFYALYGRTRSRLRRGLQVREL